MNGHLLFTLYFESNSDCKQILLAIKIKPLRKYINRNPPIRENIINLITKSLSDGLAPEDATELIAEAIPDKNPIAQTNSLDLISLESLFFSNKGCNYPFYKRKTTLIVNSHQTLNYLVM